MPDPRKYRRIYAELRELIISEEIPPGTSLPSLPELASKYSVSKDTLQHSLQLLLDEHLVTRWPGIGYYATFLDERRELDERTLKRA